MKTLFRNASIATVGLAVANVSFAESLLDETTKGFWRKPADGGSVAKLVIAAVAVLVGLALVIGAMRKA